MLAFYGNVLVAAPCSIRVLLKNEGMRITLPWNQVFLYDLRLQSATETYNAISRDGISLTATINIRFRLKRALLPSCTSLSVRITSKH